MTQNPEIMKKGVFSYFFFRCHIMNGYCFVLIFIGQCERAKNDQILFLYACLWVLFLFCFRFAFGWCSQLEYSMIAFETIKNDNGTCTAAHINIIIRMVQKVRTAQHQTKYIIV